MYKIYLLLILKLLIATCALLIGLIPSSLTAQINFSQSTLNLNGFTTINGATAMEFGPDGRLYVSDYSGSSATSGVIKALTIQRNSSASYVVTAVENLTGVATIPNYNDDGTPHL